MTGGYYDFYLTSIMRSKIALCEAQNWRCCYCHMPVEVYVGVPTKQHTATFEHVIPLTKGGSDKLDNIVIACFLCNMARNMYSAERYSRLVETLLANAHIKENWHNFTQEQVVLLKKEVEYDSMLERGNKSGTTDLSFLKNAFEKARSVEIPSLWNWMTHST